MPEKTGKEKSKRESLLRRSSSKADPPKSKKEGASRPVKPKARSVAPKKGQATHKAEEAPPISKLVTFSFDAPQASNVSLLGCFNAWDSHATPLKKNEEGVWTCTVSIEPGEHQYRFIVDGEWQDDPRNQNRCWNEFGTENCVLAVIG